MATRDAGAAMGGAAAAVAAAKQAGEGIDLIAMLHAAMFWDATRTVRVREHVAP